MQGAKESGHLRSTEHMVGGILRSSLGGVVLFGEKGAKGGSEEYRGLWMAEV